MRLAYRDLLAAHPGLEERLAHFPLRVFSARAHPIAGQQAVFFCYTLPAKNQMTNEWDNEAGRTQWYLFDVVTEKIEEDTPHINAIIASTPDTPRMPANFPTRNSRIFVRRWKHISRTRTCARCKRL